MLQTMKIGHIRHSEVASRLEQGGLLLTASSELAMQWRQRFVRVAGNVCETPAIYSWQGWLQQLGEQLPDLPTPLTHLQEQLLWEQVVRESDTGKGMPSSIRGLASQASAVYALMSQFEISEGELWGSHSEECEALARWIEMLQRQLKSVQFKGRMLASQLPARISEKLSSHTLPDCIMLDGFESLTPSQKHLLQAVQNAGSSPVMLASREESGERTVISCTDANAELLHTALRVRSLLQEYPAMQIGIVVCEAADMEPLQRALGEVLHPESKFTSGQAIPCASAPGQPFAAMPMISRLLHLLELAGKSLYSFEEFSQLLLMPYLKGAREERISRARFDADCRANNRHRLSVKGLLQSEAVQMMPQLAEVLSTLGEWKGTPRLPGEWVRDLFALLQACGLIPSAEEVAMLDEYELRQLNAFRDLLISLAAADVLGEKRGWRSFLSLLRSRCAAETLTLPARYPNVSLLPFSKIAGLHFEHLLILGLDEEALPMAARPQPLLTPLLQRKHALPLSSAPLAYATSRWLWMQALQAAPRVEISFARQRDERELSVSPFAALLPESPMLTSDASGMPVSPSETYTDTADVPVAAGEEVRGGVGIIRDQSACPFRAFASWRLGIAELGSTVPGIEPMLKGSLIHATLEHIWKKLGSQQALLALDEEGRSELIDSAVAHAWEACRSATDAASRSFEQKRMRRLLGDWLEVELSRPPFSVTDIEKGYVIELPEKGERRFGVRIKVDRIDCDSEGRRILIDYKSGKGQSPGDWRGERIKEPQLPIYAVAAGEVDAVTFALVRAGDEMGFDGLAAEDIGIKKVRPYKAGEGEPESWDALLEQWRIDIDALGEEFVQGRNEVSPRDVKVCQYCTFMGLCRIGESGMLVDTDDEA